MKFTRREMLFGTAALAAASIVESACTPEKKALRSTYEKQGTGKDLNMLHGEVANAFNTEVGERLRAHGSLRAENMRMTVKKERDGTYVLRMEVEFVSVASGERPDTVFEARSTVWTGKGAQKQVEANEKKSIEPWTVRMRAAYPDIKFREERLHGGTPVLAYRARVLVGG